MQFLKIDFDQKRNFGLDILRAVAILFVLNVHSAYFFIAYPVLIRTLLALNLDGVTLFFVLSGFLIGGILIDIFETNRATFKVLLDFWVRRWFRTLPNYFLIRVLLTLLGYYFKTIRDPGKVTSYYFFLANFKSAMPDFLFPEAWSLSIEEWFYLLIPFGIVLSIALFRLSTKSAILIVAITVILLVTGFRFYRLSQWSDIKYTEIDENFSQQVTTRLDSLMYGVFGAFMARYHLRLWKKYKESLFITGIFLLYISYLQYVVGYFSLTFLCVFSFSVKSIGFLCLFPYLTEFKTGKGIIYRTITRTSIVSYSLYLLNYSVVKNYVIGGFNLTIFQHLTGIYLALAQYCTFWLLTITGAIMLYKYFEKPFMDMRNTLAVKEKSGYTICRN